MPFSPPSVVVLDANVIYPAPVRDYLLSLAEIELYMPKWTEDKDLEKTKKAMNSAFPDANIINYKVHIKDIIYYLILMIDM